MTKMTSKTSTRRKPSQTNNTSKINNTSKASTANSTSSTIQTCQTSTTSNTSKTIEIKADLMTSQSLAISCCFFGLMCFRNTRSRPSRWPAARESTSSKDGQSSSETLKSKNIKQKNNIFMKLLRLLTSKFKSSSVVNRISKNKNNILLKLLVKRTTKK